MKVTMKGRDTNTPYQRFQKFGKALMAVPKKELDKELAKTERKPKATKRSRRTRT